ncbi:NlpC/P60 family protein [Streptomyces sp. NPDC052236]|uniref:C40 family peptidase n=1 Tax=Streptomyces sp. NPDC052236 TaxID=3365686 RepID=UPI0037D2E0C1
MSTLSSHRKMRPRTGAPGMTGLRTNTPAVGFTTAALASVTLLSTQSADAAPAEPKPSVEDVQKKVDDLYRQAGSETQKYNKAKEATDGQRREVDQLLDDTAKRTEQLNESRRALGTFAAAQYRTGAVTPTTALLFADSPQAYSDQTQLMDRVTDRQRGVVEDYEAQRAAAAKQRAEATKSLDALTRSQQALRTSKQAVQSKLSEARTLLSRLTTEERARLAAIERAREAEARRKAEAKAREEAEAEQRRQAQQEQTTGTATDTGIGTGTGTGIGTAEDGTATTESAKVVAFARAQTGKPYVWGASGPSSYDCSGLTRAAWKAAGVDLPRTTWDQANVGTRVETKDLIPGDLVFFYDDISHVGIYIGDGKMIHAPKPGTNVREESIYYMPIYGSVRPA